MKIIIAVIIALGGAVGFALLALDDPGYVVLARASHAVRMPLALFILLALLGFVLLYWIFNFIAATLRAPAQLRKWNLRRNQLNAQFFTAQGYAGLIEGDWSRAEKNLLRNLPHNQSPLLNYLGAAYAAQQQNNLRARDQYLADAHAQHPKHWLAINLTAARLHYQGGEIIKARDTLETIHRRAPRNAPCARLLAEIYRQLADWHSLAALLPKMARLNAMSPAELQRWEKTAYQKLLSSPAMLQDGGKLAQTYSSLPRAQQKNPRVLAAYCEQLIKAGRHVESEKILRRAINRNWRAELAYLYGKTETPYPAAQITRAEAWVKKYGAHADLTLTLARLYRRDKKFNKARALFTRAIADGGRDEACADLGELLDELGERDAALQCYRRGMESRALAAPRDSVNDNAGDENDDDNADDDNDDNDSNARAEVMPGVR